MAFDLSLESIKERKHKDGIFGIVYGLITLFVVGVTISHAPHASKVINDISGCPGNPSGNAMHQLRHAAPDLAPPLGDPSEDFFVEDLIHSLPYAGLMPIPCAIVIGVVWMFLLYKFALPIVYGTLILAGAILVGVGGMLFIESSNPAPLLLTAVGLLYWSFLWCWRSRIQLTAKLIEQAVVVSAAKPGIFGASAFLLVIKILSILLCFSTYALVAVAPVKVTPGTCQFDYKGWDEGPSSFDKVTYFVTTIYLYWSVNFFLCMRYYVISFTTGVWYFKSESLAAQEGGDMTKDIVKAPVLTGLRLGFTKSFSSVAFASLLVAICEYLRRMARQRGNLLACLISCCIQCILSYLEFFTRFALTFHALTGDHNDTRTMPRVSPRTQCSTYRHAHSAWRPLTGAH